MKFGFKSLCLFLTLFMGVWLIQPHAAVAAPEAGAELAWLADQIADHLQFVTGDRFGESFRDMITTILERDMSEDAPWYQTMGTAYDQCEGARHSPENTELRDRCTIQTDFAVQQALGVLAAIENLPPELAAVLDKAAEGEAEPAGPRAEEGPEPGAGPERLVLDPRTSEQHRYYQEGREVSPSQ
ncbi:MAG: hypothetical protein JRI70_03260 [Deltaproteobacteria bacterium]|nr:hypothetical protein [Deltaproteobacteria bacterium]